MIWILFIMTMALSLSAAVRVKAVYNRYNKLLCDQVSAGLKKRRGFFSARASTMSRSLKAKGC